MTTEEAREALARDRDPGVVYRPYPGAEPEEGTITSVNDSYVFVRYGRQRGSVATSPADLELLGASRAASGEEACPSGCGYESSGRDLLEHMKHEHARCPDCGRAPHKPDCPRLQPGYTYPDEPGPDYDPDAAPF